MNKAEENMMIELDRKNRGAWVKSSAPAIILALGLFLGGGIGEASGRGWFQFGIHGQGGFALGEFRNHLSDGMGGLNLEFHYSPSFSSPVSLGFSLGFLIYGIERYQDLFSSRYVDFVVDMTTTNSIINGLFSVRYHLGRGAVQPYVEGLAGFGCIRTDTSSDDDDTSQIQAENLSDSTWRFGVGSGVMIRVLQIQNRRGRSLIEGLIDVRVRYLKGGRAEFLLERGIQRAGDLLIYDVRQSRTDLWTAQAGFLVKF